MKHPPLVLLMAVGLFLAWLLGLFARRMRLSPIVGYVLAGILVGPHTPGFVGDAELAQQLAEIGVILLMFSVGLHFRVKDLLAVRGVAFWGALAQSAVTTLITGAVFAALGLPLMTSVVMGMALAVASTVVLMRVLQDTGQLGTPQGHVAVGWLIVEDLITVVLLVLIPVLGKGLGQGASIWQSGLWKPLGISLVKLICLVVALSFLGTRVIPWLFKQVAMLRSRELFTLTVLVLAISIAAVSYYVFGASMALGAFLAGMAVAQSPVSYQATVDATPIRDAFAALFFVSIGMLFDPFVLLQKPLWMAAALGIVLVLKPLIALLVCAWLGQPLRTGLTVALGLAQIGEFSFILSDAARKSGLMTNVGHSILVACAMLSILFNPFLFHILPVLESWTKRHPVLLRFLHGRALRRMNDAAPPPSAVQDSDGMQHAVIVGYGNIGQMVERLLLEAGIRTTIIDLNMGRVLEQHRLGKNMLFGDASHQDILLKAGAREASYIIVTVPEGAVRNAILATARELNPHAQLIARARYLREREEMRSLGTTAAVFEEAEAAMALARMVLMNTQFSGRGMHKKLYQLRAQLLLTQGSGGVTKRVQDVMIPKEKVRHLMVTATHADAVQLCVRAGFSRLPVVNPANGMVLGCIVSKEIIGIQDPTIHWSQRMHPLQTIQVDDALSAALVVLSAEIQGMCVVEAEGKWVGILTIEDVVEQAQGRINDA